MYFENRLIILYLFQFCRSLRSLRLFHPVIIRIIFKGGDHGCVDVFSDPWR